MVRLTNSCFILCFVVSMLWLSVCVSSVLHTAFITSSRGNMIIYMKLFFHFIIPAVLCRKWTSCDDTIILYMPELQLYI